MFKVLIEFRFHLGQRAGQTIDFNGFNPDSSGRLQTVKTVFEEIVFPIESHFKRALRHPTRNDYLILLPCTAWLLAVFSITHSLFTLQVI